MANVELINVRIEVIKSNGLIETTDFVLRVGDKNTQYLKEIRELLAPAEVKQFVDANVPLIKRQVGFGKYRSKTWEEVINIDPDYVQWVLDNVDRVKGKLHQTITEHLFEIQNDNEQYHVGF